MSGDFCVICRLERDPPPPETRIAAAWVLGFNEGMLAGANGHAAIPMCLGHCDMSKVILEAIAARKAVPDGEPVH